ncbi:hypothetical protein GIB67_010732 [Kingdonia uniflora]|uniref:Uncharacterized protein n=1 Tax=Kingdonia uniflora TaxID=39325 RepID=A0A7J7L8P0_9MAGN|nr:hypothetical protein GIB67_010732 [Kingdonia uniflora]
MFPSFSQLLYHDSSFTPKPLQIGTKICTVLHFPSQFLHPSQILTHTFHFCTKFPFSPTSLHVKRKNPWISNPYLLFLVSSPLFTTHSFHFNLFSISRGKKNKPLFQKNY